MLDDVADDKIQMISGATFIRSIKWWHERDW